MKSIHKIYHNDLLSNHYVVMFFIMIIAGIFSGMNVWAYKFDDISFSVNDFYMIFLMASWMILFMAIYYRDLYPFLIGLFMVIVIIICIRTQFLVDKNQYLLGMIPHHSMAVHITKKHLEKYNNYPRDEDFRIFLNNIIKTQKEEILYMKSKLVNIIDLL